MRWRIVYVFSIKKKAMLIFHWAVKREEKGHVLYWLWDEIRRESRTPQNKNIVNDLHLSDLLFYSLISVFTLLSLLLFPNPHPESLVHIPQFPLNQDPWVSLLKSTTTPLLFFLNMYIFLQLLDGNLFIWLINQFKLTHSAHVFFYGHKFDLCLASINN